MIQQNITALKMVLRIMARHGNEIKAAGYNSVVDFVEDVARHWENIKKGNMRAGNQTYLLEIPAKNENNSLFIELSKDGDYWNVNTGGVFRTSYSKNKKEVYNRHAQAKQSTETVGVAQGAEQSGTLTTSSANAPTTSESKGSENSENARENAANLQGNGEFNTPQGEARFSAQEQERQNIIEKARQDGTLGKAPNGAASNLMRQGGEQLWATVRTPAFKNWFGDWENDAENSSKMVDENGEPKVFYHNTNTQFTTFDETKIGTGNDTGWLGTGFYFYGDENEGWGYGLVHIMS